MEILFFLDAAVILKSNNEIEIDAYYKDTNTHYYLHYGNAQPELWKKNVPNNLSKRLVFCGSDDRRVELWLTQLRNWLKNNKYPDLIIAKASHDAEFQGPTAKPRL